MKVEIREINGTKWAICPFCGHKLFKVQLGTNENRAEIELKCSSCKNIVLVKI